MKIPFDIKFRPQIESGEYKVETRDGNPVRIICWDKKSEKKYGYHIVGLVEYGPQHEESTYYTIDGKGRLKDKEPDLFIIIPEPELSEFEKAVGAEIFDPPFNEEQIKVIKEESIKLLEIARKELVDDIQLQFDDEINKAYYQGRKDGIDVVLSLEGKKIMTYTDKTLYFNF